MKIMTNAKDAACLGCYVCTGVVIKNGVPVCRRCGSENLIDSQGRPFVPTYVTDRRNPKRVWPVKDERRAEAG